VVCVPLESDGHDVRRGVIGCPVCHAEFPIVNGVVHFGYVAPSRESSKVLYDAEALEAFLDLQGRGGYVALVGYAARNAKDLAERLPGVHVVAVNAPGTVPTESVSVLVAPDVLPLKTRSVRAVALGQDLAAPAWQEEAARVVLPGLRIVIENDAAEPEGIEVLMRGGGLLVGQKRAR
jgi:hypothetical protein